MAIDPPNVFYYGKKYDPSIFSLFGRNKKPKTKQDKNNNNNNNNRLGFGP
jgi:hypothetical protein